MKSGKLSKVLLLSQTIKEIRYKVVLSILLQHTSTLDGNKWPTSRPGRFTPGKQTQYPLNKRLGGPQNRYGRFEKNKNFSLPGNESQTV